MADSANSMTLPESNEFVRLVGDAGATFIPSGTGEWATKDRHGVTIVEGAFSRTEAARLFCEDAGLALATSDAAPEAPEPAAPNWMQRFFRAGRR